MKRVRFITAARNEFLAEVAYYNKVQSGLGRRFSEAVERTTFRALAFPQAGSPSAVETRSILVKGFPFSLVYRPDEEGIVVFAVSHHARLPGYWLQRIQEKNETYSPSSAIDYDI